MLTSVLAPYRSRGLPGPAGYGFARHRRGSPPETNFPGFFRRVHHLHSRIPAVIRPWRHPPTAPGPRPAASEGNVLACKPRFTMPAPWRFRFRQVRPRPAIPACRIIRATRRKGSLPPPLMTPHCPTKRRWATLRQIRSIQIHRVDIERPTQIPILFYSVDGRRQNVQQLLQRPPTAVLQ